MASHSTRQLAGAIVAIGMFGATVQAQAPSRRVRSQERIPTRKEIPEKPATAPAIVVPGKKIVVYEAPVVTRIVTSEAGVPVVLVERAPTAGAPGAKWLPLLGALGGAALIGTLGHSSGNETPAAAAPTPPEVPAVPPVTPPVIPPATVVPEPATMALFATGLAGMAFARRRRRP